jgi:hypothetical protein
MLGMKKVLEQGREQGLEKGLLIGRFRRLEEALATRLLHHGNG